MSGLAIRDSGGEKIVYTGSQFDGLENAGSKHLCVRTGVGESGVRKYGLTSTPLSDRYSKMKMRISAGGGNRIAYIAQKYSVSSSESSVETRNATRTSKYTNSVTLITSSKTFSTTESTISNKIEKESVTKSSTFTLSKTPAYVPYDKVFRVGNAEYKFPFSVYYASLTNSMASSSSMTTYSESFYTLSSLTTSISAGRATLTVTRKWRSITSTGGGKYRSVTDSYSYSKSFVAAQAWYRTSYVYTYIQSTSSRTTFTTSKSTTVSQASSSSVKTEMATRTSQYTLSETVTSSSSTLTNNANL